MSGSTNWSRRHSRRSTSPEGLVFAWEVLNHSHGRPRIAEITNQLGWSRRRLVERFRKTLGLPPKAVARVLRLDHTLELWKADPTTPWSDVAFAGDTLTSVISRSKSWSCP